MDMIRRLHRKFIWMATASVVAIIVLAVGLINGSLYVRVHHEISSITDIISQNGGTIPSDLAPQEKGLFEFGNWAEETPEFSYQARYFSILFDANKKEAKVINVNHIAAFNAKEAFNLAVRVLQTGKSEDFFLKDRAYYNYKITQTASGDTLVVFFDCTRDILALSSIFSYSVALGLFCIILFFLIITFLSSKAIKPFVRNMENQKRFITNASHELKTPLAGIRLLTDSILQTDHMDEETTKEFVTDIGREAERLSRITENLLRLTRLDSGVVQQPYPVAVRPVLERVERMLTMVAQEKGVTVSGAADEDAVALATDDDVHQILYNLMENAIKYSAAEDGFVRAEAHVDGDKVVLTVSDNGIGIPDEDLPHIFDRFYRVDKMRSREVGGTGLGLSIVKDTIENRGGTISAGHGANGVGTVFTVYLPLAERGEEA